MTETKEVARVPLASVEVPAGDRGIARLSIDQVARVAQWAAKSRAIERWQNVEDAAMAIMMAENLGVPPIIALQKMYPMKGTIAVQPALALGIVRQSGLCEWIMDEPIMDEAGVNIIGHRFTTKRTDERFERDSVFTLDDAKRAGLLGKSGSAWASYPQRMLKWRALGFLIADAYSDVMHGMALEPEVQDWPEPSPEVTLAAPMTGDQVPLADSVDPLLSGSTEAPQPAEVSGILTGVVDPNPPQPEPVDLPDLSDTHPPVKQTEPILGEPPPDIDLPSLSDEPDDAEMAMFK